MKHLVIATTNPGKTHEVRLALSDLPDWSVEPMPAGLPPADETGEDFIEIASRKASYYSRLVRGLTLADDSGLCVRALANRPGIHSARYGSSAGDRSRQLLTELKTFGSSDRAAAFFCALAVGEDGTVLWTVQTQLDGQIAMQPAGTSGFGYDPVFFVPELGKTLGELTAGEKNQISARGRALIALRKFLATY